jgi:antitoxin component YwqK of YwqJK toxin-antitoxin module
MLFNSKFVITMATKLYYIITLLAVLIGNSLYCNAFSSNGFGGNDPKLQNADTINRTVEGKKEGYWIIYAHMRNEPDYKPNDVIEEGRYVASRKEGFWKKYFPSGKLQSEIFYNKGKASGKFTTYYDNPKNTVEEQGTWAGKAFNEKFVRYHENGTIAQEKTFNEAGKTEGTVKYYYSNGQVELEFNTTNGTAKGTATRYWPNGEVKETITFDAEGNGTSGGIKEPKKPMPVLDEDKGVGKGVTVAGVENAAQSKGTAIVDGIHKTYDKNKNILMDGEFKGGKLWNGKHYIYDSYGLLERIEIYKDGKYIGNGVVE